MIFAQPKSKAKDAFARMDAYLLSGERIPDEFTIQRLRRDLTESLVADAAEGYMGLGLLETLLWNTEAARANFDKALQLESDFVTHANYATCLARLGDITAAAEQSRIAASMAPTDIAATERATHYSMVAGELGIANAWAQKLRKLVPGTAPDDAVAVESILAVFSGNGLHESLMAQCNRIAYSIAGEHRAVIGIVNSEADLQDGIVLLTLKLHTSEDEAQKLDAVLGCRLFDQVANYDPSKYWVGFIARSNHEHRP